MTDVMRMVLGIVIFSLLFWLDGRFALFFARRRAVRHGLCEICGCQVPIGRTYEEYLAMAIFACYTGGAGYAWKMAVEYETRVPSSLLGHQVQRARKEASRIVMEIRAHEGRSLNVEGT